MGNPGPQDAPEATRSISVAHAAALHDLTPATIYAAINKRALPARKVGSRIRIDVAALNAWFDGLDDASEAS